MIFVTSNPSSPKSDITFTTTEIRCAATIALASRFTISAILPRSTIGATRAITSTTATTMAAIFTNFFITYLF